MLLTNTINNIEKIDIGSKNVIYHDFIHFIIFLYFFDSIKGGKNHLECTFQDICYEIIIMFYREDKLLRKIWYIDQSVLFLDAINA